MVDVFVTHTVDTVLTSGTECTSVEAATDSGTLHVRALRLLRSGTYSFQGKTWLALYVRFGTIHDMTKFIKPLTFSESTSVLKLLSSPT